MTENAMHAVRRVMSEHEHTRMAPCGVGSIIIGNDVLEMIPQHVRNLLVDNDKYRPHVLFVVDKTDIRRKGVSVKPAVKAVLEETFEVTELVLDDGHPELHASEAVVEQVAAAAKHVDAVVTLGGGTISDLGKMGSARVGNPPLVVVQTAASVDGFTDDVSVLLKNGVKRTVPSRWPDVVVADSALIAEAPSHMNRAGFGEINSMFVAPADWLLAKHVGFDDGFSWGPIALLQEVGQGIQDWSPGLASADFGSIAQLTRALDIRGVATGVAGSTALLSGVEHLISHMLDISNAAHHRSIGLHGAQVGVASVVAAVVWEELFERLDTLHEVELQPTDRIRAERLVHEAFGGLDGNGQIAAECWRDYEAKLHTWESHRDAISEFVANWATHRDEFRALVKSPSEIARGLIVAGSSATFDALDPAIEPELAFWAVKHCALMRNRLTAVDVFMQFGWWTDELVAELIDRAHTCADVTIGQSA